jgi:hypothetical protein
MIKILIIFYLLSVYVCVPIPGSVVVVGWDLEKECDDLVQIHDLDRIAHIVWLEV